RTVGASDGIERWVDAQGKVLFSKKKRPTRFLGTVRDVTEHHRFEELHDQLTGVFAHDLRTPLAASLMAVQNLLTRPFAPQQEKMLRVIARSADRMERMIQQLMDFTRVRFGGGMPLARERVDLAALCRDAVREVELAYPGRTVRCDVPEECVGMWDRTSLGRLLSNLLGNALEHGLHDRSPSLTLRDEGAELVLEVHNEGAPISPDVLPVIFDPFRRERKRAQSIASMGPGLGLGLFIAKEIVSAHGGRIEARSGTAGTTFVVRMPRGAP
ncbi:MAG: ATP-binding protein, partial [Polyangiaceae bacterium]